MTGLFLNGYQDLGEEGRPGAVRGDPERQADFAGVAMKPRARWAAGQRFPPFALWHRQKPQRFPFRPVAALGQRRAQGPLPLGVDRQAVARAALDPESSTP